MAWYPRTLCSFTGISVRPPSCFRTRPLGAFPSLTWSVSLLSRGESGDAPPLVCKRGGSASLGAPQSRGHMWPVLVSVHDEARSFCQEQSLPGTRPVCLRARQHWPCVAQGRRWPLQVGLLLCSVMCSCLPFQLPSRFKLRLMWPSVCCAFLAAGRSGRTPRQRQAGSAGCRFCPSLALGTSCQGPHSFPMF